MVDLVGFSRAMAGDRGTYRWWLPSAAIPMHLTMGSARVDMGFMMSGGRQMLAGFLRQDLLPLHGPRTLTLAPQLLPKKVGIRREGRGEALRRTLAAVCIGYVHHSPMMVQTQHRPGGSNAPLTTGCVITTGGWSTYQLAVQDDRQSLFQVWHPRQLFWSSSQRESYHPALASQNARAK